MRFSVSQLLLGLSCLSTAVLASSESLFIPHSQIEDSDSAFRNNATIETGADPFDLNGLEKRQRTYCPSGTRLCQSSGRCCPSPSDGCCSGSGTCVQSSKHRCCSAGHVCEKPKECCHDRCMLAGASCCRAGNACKAGYNCVVVDGESGCCPTSGCYRSTQVIYWYYYVYWYIEVYWEIRVEVTTSTLSLTSSRETTSSTVSITASNSASASSIFESYSSSLSSEAQTTPDLSSISTSTTTSSSSTRSSTTSTSTSDSDSDSDPTESSDDDSEPIPSATADSGGNENGPQSGDDVPPGDVGAASAFSSHSLWAYIALAGLSFTMMLAL